MDYVSNLVHGLFDARYFGLIPRAVSHDKITTVMPVPQSLRDISETISHPALTQVGETKTQDGRWALLATVRRGTPRSDLQRIEEMAGDFPVVFEEESDRLPIARPAYPEQGE